eukprot:scaffold212592_cov19-Tisochrysis_lutea.AAC.2
MELSGKYHGGNLSAIDSPQRPVSQQASDVFNLSGTRQPPLPGSGVQHGVHPPQPPGSDVRLQK